MTGIELDKRLREILQSATRETVLPSVAAIAELGFSPRTAFVLVTNMLEAKDKT